MATATVVAFMFGCAFGLLVALAAVLLEERFEKDDRQVELKRDYWTQE